MKALPCQFRVALSSFLWHVRSGLLCPTLAAGRLRCLLLVVLADVVYGRVIANDEDSWPEAAQCMECLETGRSRLAFSRPCILVSGADGAFLDGYGQLVITSGAFQQLWS